MLTQQTVSSRFSEEEVRKFAAGLYGIDVSVKPLHSYIDQNFHLREISGKEYVFKIASAGEKREILDLQNQAMEHLNTHFETAVCPYVISALTGEQITRER
jgi:Ser/Thr protein kinase RdoA (MazF antagonist)